MRARGETEPLFERERAEIFVPIAGGVVAIKTARGRDGFRAFGGVARAPGEDEAIRSLGARRGARGRW